MSHTASGGDYDSATASLTVAVTDDDRGITLSESTVALTEGGSTDTYTVKLAAKHSASVTVTITSGDTGAVTRSPRQAHLHHDQLEHGQDGDPHPGRRRRRGPTSR